LGSMLQSTALWIGRRGFVWANAGNAAAAAMKFRRVMFTLASTIPKFRLNMATPPLPILPVLTAAAKAPPECRVFHSAIFGNGVAEAVKRADESDSKAPEPISYRARRLDKATFARPRGSGESRSAARVGPGRLKKFKKRLFQQSQLDVQSLMSM
jgi:hypothetical protein